MVFMKRVKSMPSASPSAASWSASSSSSANFSSESASESYSSELLSSSLLSSSEPEDSPEESLSCSASDSSLSEDDSRLSRSYLLSSAALAGLAKLLFCYGLLGWSGLLPASRFAAAFTFRGGTGCCTGAAFFSFFRRPCSLVGACSTDAMT